MPRPSAPKPTSTAKPEPHAASASGPRAVVVRETPIDLCQFIKFAGLTESGGEAKQAIADQEVQVNGILETRKRKKLMAGDQVTYNGQTIVVALT